MSPITSVCVNAPFTHARIQNNKEQKQYDILYNVGSGMKTIPNLAFSIDFIIFSTLSIHRFKFFKKASKFKDFWMSILISMSIFTHA